MIADSVIQDSVQENMEKKESYDSLSLSLSSALSKNEISVGDTLTYTVSISVDAPAIIPVLSQSSVNAKGISQESVKQVSSREIHQGETVSKVEFIYTLSISDTGSLTIPKLSFILNEGEGKTTTLQSEPYSFRVEPTMNPLPFLGGLFCAVAILGFAYFKKKKVSKKRGLQTLDLKRHDFLVNEMLLLKARVSVADSREWLRDLEKTMNNFAQWKLKEESFTSAVKNKKIPNGENLFHLFEEARYGGGNRDVFENRETWKLAVSIMNLKEDLKQTED